MNYKLVTAKERIDLLEEADKISMEVWPEFMMHDEIANKYFSKLYKVFPEYQFWLINENNIIGIGNSIPLKFSDDLKNLPEKGWDWALSKGFEDNEKDVKPNLLCGLVITINPKYQGKGFSTKMIKSMVNVGKKYGLNSLLIPVRPTLKPNYPTLSMKKYIEKKRDDGLLFDPWLRVHQKFGGEIVKICHKAMKIKGTISDWEQWTGMDFEESGDFIIPGALDTVKIDFEKDEGLYIEPNVWIHHKL
ncbi:MAG: hypothetical protein K8S23_09970 [Candidatus Cloacimonetes bacterium]|nr:hypothetical protein [Candidatus Cloacimonadota bacterium]